MSAGEPTDPADRPGVIGLPPLIYLVALVVALVVNAIVPLRLSVPTVLRWLGGVLMVGAIALAMVARTTFTRAGTNVNPAEPALKVVTWGPFGWTRNPMYLSLTILTIGFALCTRIAWVLIVLVPVLPLMHWGVVLREERYLSRKFGAEYDAYRARVRRYL